MKIEQVKKLSPFDRLAYWIVERETIRLKKEAGEPTPFTDDPILQTYRFCNVRRMDDRVSQWLLKNWYEPYFDHPNMLWAASVARFFNLPPTLDEITALVFRIRDKPDWTGIKKTIRKLKKRQTVFNAAYMVRGNDGRDKVASTIDYTIKKLKQSPAWLDVSSIQKSVAGLSDCYGFGSFMAGQVIADLRWAISGSWLDRNTWAAIGPGSRKGMNLILGRPITQPMKQDEFTIELQILTDQLNDALPKSITDRLEAIDIQNTCCEIFKYSKCLAGGRAKQTYPGV